MSYSNKPSREQQSAEEITKELNQCIELQNLMKETNAYFRKFGTCVGAPGISEERAQKLDKKIAEAKYPWDN